MKVWKRLLIKLFLLLLVIALSAGAAVARRLREQSTAEYTCRHYVEYILEGEYQKAYAMISGLNGTKMSFSDYEDTLNQKKYTLSASYKLEEKESFANNDGSQSTRYQITFFDQAGKETRSEEFLTCSSLKKLFGLFTQWKVMDFHCKVYGFKIRVPEDSEIYLDQKKAEADWLSVEEDGTLLCTIPAMCMKSHLLRVEHPVLESISCTFNPEDGNLDYTDNRSLNDSAKGECIKTGREILKAVLSAVASSDNSEENELLQSCEKEAKTFIRKQRALLQKENRSLSRMEITSLNPIVSVAEDLSADNCLQVELEFTFSYHITEESSLITEESFTEISEYEGETEQEMETEEVFQEGEAVAVFTMKEQSGTWIVTAMDIPLLGQKG